MRCTALLLVLSAIAGWAANTTPVVPKAPTDAIPVAQYINYQGVITPNPGAWTGTFTIWDDPTSVDPGDRSWTGTYSIPSDPNGLYSVQLGSGGFPITTLPEGPDCWLEIAVNGTSLSPRTQLVTVPYAWNAAGLTSNQHGICRAGESNTLYGDDATRSTHVNLGVVSSTGTSGQDNPYCTVGGGRFNAASDTNGTVGGGEWNTASGRDATVGGGYQNLASGDGATVAGGGGPCHDYNIASGMQSTIGGGRHQRAGGDFAFVGGGSNNSAAGHTATVSGGCFNCSYENYATIGGGYADTAAECATVGGGSCNSASGRYATIPGGDHASAPLDGQMAYAGCRSNHAGDAQTSLFVLRATTTGGSEYLTLDAGSVCLTVATGRTMSFDMLVAGRQEGTGNSAGWYIQGVIKNVSGTVGFVGTPVVTALGNDGIGTAVAQIYSDALVVLVTPSSGTTTRWSATVRTAEVAF